MASSYDHPTSSFMLPLTDRKVKLPAPSPKDQQQLMQQLCSPVVRPLRLQRHVTQRTLWRA
jgi:hypothetical protein